MGARLGKDNILMAVCHKDEGGLSAKEYKRKMETEKKELSQKLDDVINEYNNLVDKYNMLLNDKKALEEQNNEKAREIVDRQQVRGR